MALLNYNSTFVRKTTAKTAIYETIEKFSFKNIQISENFRLKN